MSKNYDVNELIEQKNQLLLKKKSIPKENTEELKEIMKEYYRIFFKIRYYRNDEFRLKKNLEDSLRHKGNKELYNEYQRLYMATRRANVVC